MGTRSINKPKSDVLSELRLFAHKNDMSMDESLWPNRIKMVGRVTELFFGRKFCLPLGPHFEINISCSSDADSPSSTLVSVYAKPTTRGRVIYWSIITASYLLIGIGLIWSVMTGKLVYIIVCSFASSPLWPFGSAVSDRVSWAETWFWRSLPKLATNSNILSTEVSARIGTRNFMYFIGGMFSVLAAILISIMMFRYAVFNSTCDLSLFIGVMGGILGFTLSLLMFAQRLPLFSQFQFIEVFKSTLICIALNGPLWLFSVFILTCNVAQNVPPQLDVPIWETISPRSLSDCMMGLIFVAFMQFLFIYLVGFITVSIQSRLSQQMEYLHSAKHVKLLKETKNEKNRDFLLALGFPLIVIQAMAWIGSTAGIVLLVLKVILRMPERLWQFITASGTSVLNNFLRHGFVEQIECVPNLIGMVLGVSIVAFLLFPWLIPINILSERIRSLKYAKSHALNPQELYEEPIIAGDMQLAAESVANTKLELRWDINERTARYEKTGRDSWAIIINPELWAAAKSGDLMPLRFTIYHEAVHIRHVKSQMRWKLLKWICLPVYASTRILRSPGLKEEFEADLEAARYLGGETIVIGILERLAAGYLGASDNFSIKRYCRIILDAFLLDTVYFTPHPKTRALYLRAYSQCIKNQSSM